MLKELDHPNVIKLLRVGHAARGVARRLTRGAVLRRGEARQRGEGPPQGGGPRPTTGPRPKPARSADAPSRATRRKRHSLQLFEWLLGRNLDIMHRSAHGMIRVYNLLPRTWYFSKT